MKKYLIALILSFTLGLLLASSMVVAKQTTMSTYYPSSSGAYTKVLLVNGANGPNENACFCAQNNLNSTGYNVNANGSPNSKWTLLGYGGTLCDTGEQTAGPGAVTYTNAGTIFSDPNSGYMEICKSDGSAASYVGACFNRFCTGAGCYNLAGACPNHYTAVKNQQSPFPSVTSTPVFSYSCCFYNGTTDATHYAQSGCFSLFSSGNNIPGACYSVDPNAYDMGCQVVKNNCSEVRTCCFNSGPNALGTVSGGCPAITGNGTNWMPPSPCCAPTCDQPCNSTQVDACGNIQPCTVPAPIPPCIPGDTCYNHSCCANCGVGSDDPNHVSSIPAANCGSMSVGSCMAGYTNNSPTYQCMNGSFGGLISGSCTCSSGVTCFAGTVCCPSSSDECSAFTGACCLPTICTPTYVCGSTAGTDNCGNPCTAIAGTCPTNEVCSGVTHTCSCPNNMCGGSCCTGVQTECDAGVCCQPTICTATYACGSTAGTDNCGNACIATAGTCPTNEVCSGVTHTCSCPNNMCGGSCCTGVQTECDAGVCCQPVGSCVATYACGSTAGTDNCGNPCTATAGTCPTNEVCSGVTHTCSCPNNMCGGSCCTGVQTECDAGVCCQPIGGCSPTYACGSTAGTDNCGNACTATAGTCPGCCTGSHTCATVDACGVCGGNGSECCNAGNCSGSDACFSSTCCGPYSTSFTVATGSVYCTGTLSSPCLSVWNASGSLCSSACAQITGVSLSGAYGEGTCEIPGEGCTVIFNGLCAPVCNSACSVGSYPGGCGANCPGNCSTFCDGSTCVNCAEICGMMGGGWSDSYTSYQSTWNDGCECYCEIPPEYGGCYG